jgi:hypothetical protein
VFGSNHAVAKTWIVAELRLGAHGDGCDAVPALIERGDGIMHRVQDWGVTSLLRSGIVEFVERDVIQAEWT